MLTCQRLDWLEGSGTDITDIAPVAALERLRVLDLDWTGVTDLSPLKNIQRLEELYLQKTAIEDLAPVAPLANLKVIELFFAEVPDLRPLAKSPITRKLGLGKHYGGFMNWWVLRRSPHLQGERPATAFSQLC